MSEVRVKRSEVRVKLGEGCAGQACRYRMMSAAPMVAPATTAAA